MSLIGAAGPSFTLNQRQIDIEFALPPPAPTRLVHVCIGRGLGFIYAEALMPNGHMPVPVNVTVPIDASDFGSSLTAPQPQGAPLPVTYWWIPNRPHHIPGYTFLFLRRLKLRSVFSGHKDTFPEGHPPTNDHPRP
jgi:hypothetical protein